MTVEWRAAEYVFPGHPDKLCDAIADAVVQEVGRREPRGLCGVEVAVHRDHVYVTGQVAGGLDEANFRSMLGVDKYRGYLNYFYGITVEEALQVTVEQEVFKRYTSNGVRSRGDYTDEAFERIYGAPGDELLAKFRCELGREKSAEMTLTESKEFTYWLFKYRVHRSDNSRVASDTKKGLEQLQGMKPYE